MGRYSTAYADLVDRAEEVGAICKKARQLERTRPLGAEAALVSALCRGGVVLMSSHIEGFIFDLNQIILDEIFEKGVAKSQIPSKFRYHHSKDILKQVLDTSDTQRVAEKLLFLFERDSHIWGDGDAFTASFDNSRFMKGFSTPKPNKIYEFFRRYGYDSLKHDIQSEMKGEFRIHESNVLALVDMRNAIAHGDKNVTQTPADLTRLTNSTKAFCRYVDIMVGNWFRSINCAIR